MSSELRSSYGYSVSVSYQFAVAEMGSDQSNFAPVGHKCEVSRGIDRESDSHADSPQEFF